MIKEKPTLLETFSFIFFYPSCLIGPSFEFKDYIQFIRLEGDYQNIPWKQSNLAALKEFLMVLVCLFIRLNLGKNFSTKYCGTEEYVEKSIGYKYIYMVLSMLVMRSTYYVGWKLSQSSINFSGLSYNKKLKTEDSEDNFDKIESCNLQEIELNLNPRTRIQYWNRTVHLWLKYYLFLRFINIPFKPFKNNKTVASLLTFMISALWHGYYPVYFIFFFEYYMIEQVSTFLDEEYDLFNKIAEWNWFFQLLYRIFLMSVVNYFGLAFSILTVRENINYYKAFHYIPLLFLFISWLVTLILPRKKKVTKITRNTETPKVE
jgi:lysophospholipid acyltransferase